MLSLVHRILYIEDDARLRRGIAKHLRARGIEVVEAADLDEALAVSLDDIDAILADVWLGHRRVHEIVPELLARQPGMPIVALSGASDGADGFELSQLGVRTFLTKPAKTDEIVDALESTARTAASGDDTRIAEFKKLRRFQLERLIREALTLSGGTVAEAARLLGYTTPALRYQMDRLGIRSKRRARRASGVERRSARSEAARSARERRR